jgi:Uma2 family endonuclease
MTVATDIFTSVTGDRKLTLNQYLNYEDGTGQRYEILDGVLVEMGTESALNLSIAFVLGMALANLGIPGYLIGSKHRIAVSSTQVSVREPDLLVHSEASYATVSQKKESQQTEFRGSDSIVSAAFPNLKLTAEQVLKAGR